ncbi:LLM class flavin-dependent oxidoreductase [Microbacterium betulae]|uniref:LLM class flavin-dependent oxidoreductase n=1 Tax=Microbacterium betulae TaxID=2981139 RepID=A0AA97I487_9MICO|nr:LLM class flavin-dependent oxidoreductase [Microbacterium sp. AB]WOF22351.1 LLM class flavin-dependent oxidoreductase [Microbacterium sp. AB]
MTSGILLPPASSASTAGALADVVETARRLDAGTAPFLVVTAAAVGGLSPLHVAAHLGARTSRIGIVVEHRADGVEPSHMSSALATLDHTTRGRAGWLIPDAGRDAEAMADAAAVVDAVALLWDSWEDDAVIRDRATGRYLDRAKLHAVDATGPDFTIAGPSITPRPPQGRPVVLLAAEAAALASEGRSARWVDIVLDGADSRGVSIAGPDTAGCLGGEGVSGTTLREVLGLDRPASVFSGRTNA